MFGGQGLIAKGCEWSGCWLLICCVTLGLSAPPESQVPSLNMD